MLKQGSQIFKIWEPCFLLSWFVACFLFAHRAVITPP